ncbi:hypothetical protein SLE2022_403160 [Rubroshorea leprosula]
MTCGHCNLPIYYDSRSEYPKSSRVSAFPAPNSRGTVPAIFSRLIIWSHSVVSKLPISKSVQGGEEPSRMVLKLFV